MRIARLGAWLLLAMHIAFAVLAFGALPEQVPMHIGLGGEPGNFARRSAWSWSLLPALALLLQLLLSALVPLIRRRPQLFNFPEKARFLALPEADRAPVIAEMVRVLDVCALGVQALLVLVLGQLFEAAQGERSVFGALAVPLFAVLLTPTLLVLVARVSGAVERAEAGARGQGR